MITGIAIENFKGIGARVELELRPITLLFGANSAGKSTIFHALHYAREIFERHNLDADQTISGGNYVDLGGFASFVHQGDRSAKVRIGITVSLGQDELPSFSPDPPEYDLSSGRHAESPLVSAKSASVEIQIGWSDRLEAPFVEEYVTKIDDEFIASITATPGRRTCELTVNPYHRSLAELSSSYEELQIHDPIDQDDFAPSALHGLLQQTYEAKLVPGLTESLRDPDPDICWFDFELAMHDALPSFDDWLDIEYEVKALPYADWDLVAYWKHYLLETMTQIVAGPGQLVRDELRNFRYLGPLRETPPRNYQPPRFADTARWSSGLGAWDALQNGLETFVESVSNWLGDEDKLDTGYLVERRHYKQLDMADPLVVKLLTGRAFDEADEGAKVDIDRLPTHTRLVILPEGSEIELRPHDVGIGISQIVPVVVTSLADEGRVLSIEQPELHLHPKLQAKLGDLFIEAALGDRKHLIILETHSEHLILRLLRRIRETESGKVAATRQLRTDDLAIYYLKQEHGSSRELRIDVDVKGEFIQPWPDDFFEIDFYERFS